MLNESLDLTAVTMAVASTFPPRKRSRTSPAGTPVRTKRPEPSMVDVTVVPMTETVMPLVDCVDNDAADEPVSEPVMTAPAGVGVPLGDGTVGEDPLSHAATRLTRARLTRDETSID